VGSLQILISTKVRSAALTLRIICIDTYLGFILDKTIAVNSPKRMEGVRILIANTCKRHTFVYENIVSHPGNLAMDTDKIKIFGARVKVDGTGKLAELERAEKVRPLLSSPTTLLKKNCQSFG
jgi:putative ubiquitin-RnfH superfamily antitoxin RatB of RatAB toxin-antitoxin module